MLDPTVRLDGIAVWENGRLNPERLRGGAQLLEEYEDLRAVFAAPESEVGAGADGRLTART